MAYKNLSFKLMFKSFFLQKEIIISENCVNRNIKRHGNVAAPNKKYSHVPIECMSMYACRLVGVLIFGDRRRDTQVAYLEFLVCELSIKISQKLKR